MLICDKCNAGISAEAKFCPQCGDPVTDADKVSALVQESQVANVEISFGKSSSPNFSKAVKICENIPTYSLEGDGKLVLYKVMLPITEVDLIINLFDLVGSWKSSKMLINGHLSTKKALTYYGVGCYRNRQKAYELEQFCFGDKEHDNNIWGCKKLNMPISEWGGGWLEYGEFDNSGVWHFNKDRIQHELELALKENELCPVLDRKRVLETLKKLPNTINPKNDNNWEYRTSYEEVDGEYKEVAVGIKPNYKKINRFVVGGFQPSWEDSADSQYSQTEETEETTIINKKSKYSLWWVVTIIIIIYMIFK